MAVAAERMTDEMTLVATLDERRALLVRRRLLSGLREWTSLLATGMIGAWLVALVALTVFNG